MNQLLDLAVEAHGGLERWRAIERLEVSLSCSGFSFLWMKGYPEGLPNITARIKMRRPVVSIRPYTRVDGCGHFTPDRVWIDDDKGHVLKQCIEPRASFAGHALETPWDQLQLLYFVSYGLWNYFNTPFFLIQPGFEVREIEPHEENGEIWRCSHIARPGGHSPGSAREARSPASTPPGGVRGQRTRLKDRKANGPATKTRRLARARLWARTAPQTPR
jgi:hypothetical protein